MLVFLLFAFIEHTDEALGSGRGYSEENLAMVQFEIPRAQSSSILEAAFGLIDARGGSISSACFAPGSRLLCYWFECNWLAAAASTSSADD